MSIMVARFYLVLYSAEDIPSKRKMPRRKPEVNLVRLGTNEQFIIGSGYVAST